MRMSDDNSKGTTINQNVTSYGQTGGITAHTVNVGTPKLKFDVAIGDELVRKLPPGKPIRLQCFGPDSDQQIGDQYQAFLVSRGFKVAMRDSIKISSSPPEDKLSVFDAGAEVIIKIAPRA
jgi:hypothetical protein